MSARNSHDVLGRRGVGPVLLAALLVLALVGSVAAPAIETGRIMHALLDITTTIDPARALSWRLESGIAIEYSALQGYALSGDREFLLRYQMKSEEDARDLRSLEALAPKLGSQTSDAVAAVRHRIVNWQDLNRMLLARQLEREDFAAAASAQRAVRDSIIDDLDRLPMLLSNEAGARVDEVRQHEWGGLFVNAALVLVALVAIAAVAAFRIRERRLATILERRVEEESSLRRAARALSAAATIDDALRSIVEATAATTHARAVYVEFAPASEDAVYSAALAGTAAPALNVRTGHSGSLTEEIEARGHPILVSDIESMHRWLPPELMPECKRCTGLVAPLSSSGETLGVLVLLRESTTGPFGDDERRQTGLLSDLAAAVLRRVEAERTALTEAQQRATHESALRQAAEALAGAFTVDDVSQQIARSALHATQARGAWVEHVDTAPDAALMVVVRGAAGNRADALGHAGEYAGSYTEHAINADKPLFAAHLAGAELRSPASNMSTDASSMLVLPLGRADARIGALFIDGPAPGPSGSYDMTWADTFAHLADLAYEKVRLLDEAREGRRKLERVMKSRQRLMRGFSHDVKNPLGAADGYAELLSAGVYGEISQAQRATIERMRGSIHGALALIDDLHELARTETGNIVLRLQAVDLGELARAIGEEYRGAAKASGLSFDLDVAADLPITVTDPGRVRQIVGNLLSNAIKYTTAGSVTLRVSASQTRLPGAIDGSASFQVIDTGVGIPANKREVIFEEFSRLGATDKPGAGLGLTISKRLADALGGEIGVESELGRGSTFTLRIPIRTLEASNAVQAGR